MSTDYIGQPIGRGTGDPQTGVLLFCVKPLDTTINV